jgi:hypothetical protein
VGASASAVFSENFTHTQIKIEMIPKKDIKHILKIKVSM